MHYYGGQSADGFAITFMFTKGDYLKGAGNFPLLIDPCKNCFAANAMKGGTISNAIYNFARKNGLVIEGWPTKDVFRDSGADYDGVLNLRCASFGVFDNCYVIHIQTVDYTHITDKRQIDQEVRSKYKMIFMEIQNNWDNILRYVDDIWFNFINAGLFAGTEPKLIASIGFDEIIKGFSALNTRSHITVCITVGDQQVQFNN